MIKGILTTAALLLASIGLTAQAPTTPQATQASQSTVFSAVATSTPVNETGLGLGFHRLIWEPVGTVSTCTVKLEQSSTGDVGSWTDLIAAQTCTSAGRSSISSVNNALVRVSVTVLSGGGRVAINYTGFSDSVSIPMAQVLADTPSAVQPTLYSSGGTSPQTQTQHGEQFVQAKDIKHDPMGFASDHGRTVVGMDSQVIYEPMDASTINTNTLVTATTGAQTITQTVKELTLNASALTTIATASQISTVKSINFLGHFPIHGHWIANATTCPAGSVIEMGFGNASGTTTPTDGAFFRCSNGAWQGVLNFNGSETTCSFTVDGVDLSPTAGVYQPIEIIWSHRKVGFWVALKNICLLAVPGANPAAFTISHMPFYARVTNSGTPATAAQLRLSEITIGQRDINWGKNWRDIIVSSTERGAWQNPVPSWNQLENWVNSTPPASATLSNTAAGYTTLGGQWQFAAVAGANTDFALFGYQVPTGFQLYVTRVSISCMDVGAAVGASATVMQWGVAVNSSGVSLATAESPPTSWQPRRLAIGQNSLPGAGAIGTQCANVIQDFDPPLIVDSGRFFHIILTVPIGLATASEVIQGTVMVNGYFE